MASVITISIVDDVLGTIEITRSPNDNKTAKLLYYMQKAYPTRVNNEGETVSNNQTQAVKECFRQMYKSWLQGSDNLELSTALKAAEDAFSPIDDE